MNLHTLEQVSEGRSTCGFTPHEVCLIGFALTINGLLCGMIGFLLGRSRINVIHTSPAGSVVSSIRSSWSHLVASSLEGIGDRAAYFRHIGGGLGAPHMSPRSASPNFNNGRNPSSQQVAIPYVDEEIGLEGPLTQNSSGLHDHTYHDQIAGMIEQHFGDANGQILSCPDRDLLHR